MRRRTRRRLVGLALAAAGLAGVRYRDQVPDVSPAAAYVRSGQWHGIAWFLLAVAASWLGWRLRPARRAPVGSNRRTALYRWYDVEARLLYVGVAFNPVGRAGQHQRSQPWWGDVRSATVEWFDTRVQALDEEEDAIKRERPQHNIVHARRGVLR